MGKTSNSEFAQALKVATDTRKSHIYLYEEYIDMQREGFLDTIRFLQRIIEKLIEEEKISSNTRIVARIKDMESALMNDQTVNIEDSLMDNLLKSMGEELKAEEGKKVDDSFGITIISNTKKDMKKILDSINNETAKQDEKGKIHRSIKKDKMINESNRNYRAIHSYLWVDLDETEKTPIVECKLMLESDYVDAYDHTIYKVEHLIGRKLSEEEILKVRIFIQEYYNNGKFRISKNIPQMFESEYNLKSERMELRELDSNEILKIVYPFLDTDSPIQKEEQK